MSNRIPRRTDKRHRGVPGCGQLSFFAPKGTLAIPGASRAGLPEPRRGEPFLGPATPSLATGGPAPTPADYERLLRAQLGTPYRPTKKSLDSASWLVPRASMWAQLSTRRLLVSTRQAKCQRTRFQRDADVTATRSPSGKWGLSGVISCGKMTCPCCGRRKARAVASLLGVCFERHREQHVDGDHWMLTLTAPHRPDDATGTVLGWLYAGAARFFRGRAWQAFEQRWGIEARVRVLDAVHGGSNGCHPHFHVALFPQRVRVDSSQLLRLERDALAASLSEKRRELVRRTRQAETLATNEERNRIAEWEAQAIELMGVTEALVDEADASPSSEPLRKAGQAARRAFLRELAVCLYPAWREALRAAGCPHSPNLHAIDLLPSDKAERYFLKWGLADEIALSTEKDRSHLRLLDVAGAGLGKQSDVAADLYRDFVVASHGRCWVAGVTDTCAKYSVTKDDAAAYIERMRERRNAELAAAGEPPLVELPRVSVAIRSHLWRAFLSLDPDRVFEWLDDALDACPDPARVQLTFDDFLWSTLALRAHSDTS